MIELPKRFADGERFRHDQCWGEHEVYSRGRVVWAKCQEEAKAKLILDLLENHFNNLEPQNDYDFYK